MDERDLEFPRLGETALPPEFTPLPDEFGQSGGTAPPAKAGRTLWKKVLYALAGLSALTAVTLSGAGTAPETTVLPETPSAQEETYPLEGTLYCTVYNDTFGPDGQPLVLLDRAAVEVSALADAPMTLPQPQQPVSDGAVFLGWVGHYDTAAGRSYRLLGDALTASDAAAIRPAEDGSRTLEVHAAWRGDGAGRFPWQLTLDDGDSAAAYDASVPLRSGGTVYLCAYPVPERAGLRFAGWRDRDGAPVETLPAAAFFAAQNGETDWSAPRAVTLYARWETA